MKRSRIGFRDLASYLNAGAATGGWKRFLLNLILWPIWLLAWMMNLGPAGGEDK